MSSRKTSEPRAKTPPRRKPRDAPSRRPALWIFAGPNGSGKSTFHTTQRLSDDGSSIWVINPDLLAKRVAEVEGRSLRDANLEAVKRIQRWLSCAVRAHQTIGVETVLSTSKYRRLVRQAIDLGFEIQLVYVVLKTPELSVARVRQRVRKGGHSVPEDKIVERYWRSLKQMPWFFKTAERAWVFDNSGAKPRQIAIKEPGTFFVADDALPAIKRALGV